MTAGVREKILSVLEAPRPQVIRIEQLLNRIAHRGILIEKAYQVTLWGHGTSTEYQSKCRSECKMIAGPTSIVPWDHAARALRPPSDARQQAIFGPNVLYRPKVQW
jgi:hypothetical protein